MKEKIEIRLNFRTVLLHILGAFMFVALGYIMIVNPIDIKRFRSPFVKLIAIVCILYFGYILIMNIVLMIKGARYLAIAKEDGFYTNDTFASWGKIEWEDIESFEIRNFGGLPYISVNVVDYKKYFNKLNFIERAICYFNKKFEYGIGIRLQLTGLDPNILCLELNNYKKKIIEYRKNKI